MADKSSDKGTPTRKYRLIAKKPTTASTSSAQAGSGYADASVSAGPTARQSGTNVPFPGGTTSSSASLTQPNQDTSHPFQNKGKEPVRGVSELQPAQESVNFPEASTATDQWLTIPVSSSSNSPYLGSGVTPASIHYDTDPENGCLPPKLREHMRKLGIRLQWSHVNVDLYTLQCLKALLHARNRPQNFFSPGRISQLAKIHAEYYAKCKKYWADSRKKPSKHGLVKISVDRVKKDGDTPLQIPDAFGEMVTILVRIPDRTDAKLYPSFELYCPPLQAIGRLINLMNPCLDPGKAMPYETVTPTLWDLNHQTIHACGPYDFAKKMPRFEEHWAARAKELQLDRLTAVLEEHMNMPLESLFYFGLRGAYFDGVSRDQKFNGQKLFEYKIASLVAFKARMVNPGFTTIFEWPEWVTSATEKKIRAAIFNHEFDPSLETIGDNVYEHKGTKGGSPDDKSRLEMLTTITENSGVICIEPAADFSFRQCFAEWLLAQELSKWPKVMICRTVDYGLDGLGVFPYCEKRECRQPFPIGSAKPTCGNEDCRDPSSPEVWEFAKRYDAFHLMSKSEEMGLPDLTLYVKKAGSDIVH